jgi:hypothetical protein
VKLRDIISEEIVKTSAGGDYDDLNSTIVKENQIMEVTHIAVENKTSAYTRLTIGPADGLSFFEKEEEDTPPANDIFWTRSRFYIRPGKTLRARLTGCTATDSLRMTYEGKIYETKEG